jgi:hypothetical protein
LLRTWLSNSASDIFQEVLYETCGAARSSSADGVLGRCLLGGECRFLWLSFSWQVKETFCMVSQFADGADEAQADIVQALRSGDPYAVVMDKWTESALACDLAEARNDASTYIYEQEKIVIYRRYLAEYSM